MVRGHTREEEIGMMSHPDRWPHTVVLPLKRRVEGKTWPQVGYLRQLSMRHPAPAPQPVVYLREIWRPAPADDKDVPLTAEYDSIEAIVDDGWVVD